MTTRRLAAMLIGMFLLVPVGPRRAHAQADDLNLGVATSYEYGLWARFALTTDRPSRVQRAQLFFFVADSPQLVSRPGGPAADGAAEAYEVTLDLVSEPFPPFSTITCWWRIETIDGLTILSPRSSFFYSDNRMEWQILADVPIELRWTEAQTGPETAGRVLPRAHAILNSIESTLGLPTPGPVSIYVYPSAESLRDGLLITDPSFAADYAVPGPRMLVIAATAELLSPARLDRIVARGLTESILYDATRERYANIPAWFREGLGLLMEPEYDPQSDPSLPEAMDSQSLPAAQVLCAEEEVAPPIKDLRPALAASLLEHWLARYGQDGVLRVLSAYAEGASCEKGVSQGLGQTMDQLEMEWLARTSPGAMVRRLSAQLSPWLLLLVPVLILVVLSILPSRRGMRLVGRRPLSSRPYESPDSHTEDDSE